jgi:predicted protein tyrosine phosphatase
MKIEIESRESIKIRAKELFSVCTALISVTDTDHNFVMLNNKPEYLLQMKFDDVSNEIFEDILGRKPTEAEELQLTENFHMFNDEQAEKIAEFVKSVSGKSELLICQCEYGQSRSAGIAAAVRQFLYGDGIEIFADERYYPNKLVYRKVLAAIKNLAKEG